MTKAQLEMNMYEYDVYSTGLCVGGGGGVGYPLASASGDPADGTPQTTLGVDL
jgi:hypothetical protein